MSKKLSANTLTSLTMARSSSIPPLEKQNNLIKSKNSFSNKQASNKINFSPHKFMKIQIIEAIDLPSVSLFGLYKLKVIINSNETYFKTKKNTNTNTNPKWGDWHEVKLNDNFRDNCIKIRIIASGLFIDSIITESEFNISHFDNIADANFMFPLIFEDIPRGSKPSLSIRIVNENVYSNDVACNVPSPRAPAPEACASFVEPKNIEVNNSIFHNQIHQDTPTNIVDFALKSKLPLEIIESSNIDKKLYLTLIEEHMCCSVCRHSVINSAYIDIADGRLLHIQCVVY